MWKFGNITQQLMHNIQMMTNEPWISIVTKSGVVTSSDKEDGKKEFEDIGAWVRKF